MITMYPGDQYRIRSDITDQSTHDGLLSIRSMPITLAVGNITAISIALDLVP